MVHRPPSLRTQLGVGLALLVFAIAGGLGTLLGQSSVEQLRARIGQSLEMDSARMADRINKEMAARARELALIGAVDPLRGLNGSAPDPARVRQQTQSLLDGLKRSYPFYVWIGICDPQGHVIVGTGGQLVGTDISARPSMPNSVQNNTGQNNAGRNNAGQNDAGQNSAGQNSAGQNSTRAGQSRPAAGPPVHRAAPGQDQWVMDLVSPVQADDGSVTAIVAAQLSWNWVSDVEKSILTNDGGSTGGREAFLVGPHDEVLLGPPGTMGGHLNLTSIDRARAGIENWSVQTWPNGEDYLTGAAFASGEGQYPGPGSQEMRWTVLVREKSDTAFAPAYQLRDNIVTAGALFAVLFALAGWLLAAWITAPMIRIAEAAERIRRGESVELPKVTGAAEIVSLSEALRDLVRTLTSKQLALDDLEEIAQRDPLTGLLNRNGLRQYLGRALAQARLSGISLMVIMGDLDGFKSVNDTMGHAAGDALLCEVARRMTASVRPHDTVARLGGDEFVLVLEAAGGAADVEVLALARQILATVQRPVVIDGRLVQIGCSLGGAAWPDHGDTFDQVMERADAALYRAKRAGKGRVELQPPALSQAS